jgi:hypothetical protein
MNTYTWTINQVSAANVEAQTGVVTHVHWSLEGKTDQNDEILSFKSGTKTIAYVAGGEFVPLENLTKEQVIAWLEQDMAEQNETGLTVLDCIKQAIDADIDRQLAATVSIG